MLATSGQNGSFFFCRQMWFCRFQLRWSLISLIAPESPSPVANEQCRAFWSGLHKNTRWQFLSLSVAVTQNNGESAKKVLAIWQQTWFRHNFENKNNVCQTWRPTSFQWHIFHSLPAQEPTRFPKATHHCLWNSRITMFVYVRRITCVLFSTCSLKKEEEAMQGRSSTSQSQEDIPSVASPTTVTSPARKTQSVTTSSQNNVDVVAHGQANPLAWENLPSELRERMRAGSQVANNTGTHPSNLKGFIHLDFGGGILKTIPSLFAELTPECQCGVGVCDFPFHVNSRVFWHARHQLASRNL